MVWEHGFLLLGVYPKFLRDVGSNLTSNADFTDHSQNSYLPVLSQSMLVFCFWGSDANLLDFQFSNSCTVDHNPLEPPEPAEAIDAQIPLQYNFRRSWELRETVILTLS